MIAIDRRRWNRMASTRVASDRARKDGARRCARVRSRSIPNCPVPEASSIAFESPLSRASLRSDALRSTARLAVWPTADTLLHARGYSNRRPRHCHWPSVPLDVPLQPKAMRRATRATVSIAVGALFAALTYALLRARGPQVQGADFTYTWAAARALLHGQNPYAVVGGANVPFGGRFNYPLTAALMSVPLAWASAAFGAIVMVGASAACCAYAITRRSLWPLLMFASGQAFMVASSAQWSFWCLFAACCAPVLGLIAGVKPNVAFAALAYQSRWRGVGLAIAVGFVLLFVSLAIDPRWPLEWRHTLRTSATAGAYLIPLRSAWGAPLALAALRWRRPEARLLLCMAAIPQAAFLYEQLPLLLVPQTRREMMLAVALSQVALVAPTLVHFDRTNAVTLSRSLLPLVIVTTYLPALIMILRRPNEAALRPSTSLLGMKRI